MTDKRERTAAATAKSAEARQRLAQEKRALGGPPKRSPGDCGDRVDESREYLACNLPSGHEGAHGLFAANGREIARWSALLAETTA